MNNIQNTYRRPAPRGWRERWMRWFGMNTVAVALGKGELTMPNWIVNRSVLFFFISFIACTIAFGYPMELRFALVSSVSVLLFFYGGRSMLSSWLHLNSKAFEKNVYQIGLLVRVFWILFCYFYFNPENYENTMGEEADTGWYMEYAKNITAWIGGEQNITFEQLRIENGSAIDDLGYPLWLAIGYLIWGGFSDVFMPFIIKSLVGAFCAISIYRIAKRHFGEGTARLAAVFVALNPNMIYWCGTMFKETEMMFLCCLCVDLVDETFTSGKKLTWRGLLPGVLVGMYLFFFRSALAVVIFLAIFAHVVMASQRVMSLGKKIIAGILVGVVLLVGLGDRLRMQTQSIMQTVQSDAQARNMEWRANREGGNSFARYAGAAVFAPLIFTIPFPTFNIAEQTQILQRQLSGGNYIKNILSFFVIIIMLMMLISGEWRRHVFILAYTLGYLTTLVLSSFAQSSRFHMPIWPFIMLFAAYGIQIAKSNARVRKWFPMVLVLEVMICLAWNWFKLAGRGMV